jgi:hypothetical protein
MHSARASHMLAVMALCNVSVMARLFDSLFSVRVICFLISSLVSDQLFDWWVCRVG